MKGASCVALFLSHKNCRRFVCVPQKEEKLLAIPTDVRPNIHSAIKASCSVSIFIFEQDDKKRVLFCDKNGPLRRASISLFYLCKEHSGESSDFLVLSGRRFSSLERTKIRMRRITLSLIRKWVDGKISHATAISRPNRSRTMLNGVVIVNSDNKAWQLLPLRICSRYWEQLCANELFLFQPIKRKFYKTSFNTSTSPLRHTFVCSIKKS